ncbi:MAG: hypothetical protein O2780_19570, partial [Proteobacteria bacterium]|nr:hypothetical protein [Pseudomonadota bacterium]
MSLMLGVRLLVKDAMTSQFCGYVNRGHIVSELSLDSHLDQTLGGTGRVLTRVKAPEVMLPVFYSW